MADKIKHQGVVESIGGDCIRVKIMQTSACSSCSAKGYCSSIEVRKKIVNIRTTKTESYRPGDKVWVIAELSMGIRAITWAFVYPFFILLSSLFMFMALWSNELYSALSSLFLLVVYYIILWLNKGRIGKKFVFYIQPMNN